LQPDVLDINLGCSAPSVSNRGAGAGLLKNPRLIADIFTQLVKISPIPVTAKIRLGWDDDSRNYLEVSRILEDCGAALIAVHGRTKKQAYKGRSDWQAIAEVKAHVSIPVIANGDVRTPADITAILAVTKCDGVMIGRGSFGNPWIFSARSRDQVPYDEVEDIIWQHLLQLEDFYGSDRGHVIFRKHLKAYLQPFAVDRAYLRAMLTASSSLILQSLIKDTRQHIQTP
jgi:nifR3 family TIM-barrel protein